MNRHRAGQPGDSAQSSASLQQQLKGFDDFDLSLGDIMRAERATMGKSLLDVQFTLKIRASYIVAIENCDPSAFDVPAYLPGYVRSYARFLGLDPDWVLARFCEEGNYSIESRLGPTASGAASHRAEPTRPTLQKREPFRRPITPFTPKPEGFLSRIDPPALLSSLVLGGLILAIGYGGWAVLEELQRVQIVQTDQTADMSAPVEPLGMVGSSTSSGTDTIVAARPRQEELDRLYRRPQVLQVPVVSPRDPPIATLNPEQVATVAEVRDDLVVPLDTPPSVENGGEVPQESPVQVVEEEIEEQVREVVLLAVRPSWVRVRTADDSVLLEKILDGGERYVVPRTEQPPILRTGNAGSVYFLVNGEAYGPLGEGPTVVDDIVMGSEEVVAGFAVADPEADSKLAELVAMAVAPQTEQEASQ